ncbi:tRNA-guanine transglycosylase DpdA [Archangium lansingense]|uniref:tRNA-guanine transglycosylase DpdA n=1 Tax=Archangium lansingense TaxID=2995310 RepID=A0ABT3ZX50_9BACT|nr:tRNA-guanine transglycosylase DpdA [Archangium lansinium]MCY1073968.1 tRNA-guanine transglycosylase DpdA [Archangium lansinium]
MKFFLPDSQDLVDPTFDFERERRSVARQRQTDDLYAHEIFSMPAFDGLLVSKGIVDGFGALGSRYTAAQRHRLLRRGAPEFFRLERAPHPLKIMGDCGAFTYVAEEVPPYSVDEVLEFYGNCRFDMGVSLDHVILEFKPAADTPGSGVEIAEPVRDRQKLTLELAQEFLHKHKVGRYSFEPLGVAQGWSPKSYAAAVKALQKMGYDYIALGGMVPLKTPELHMCLEEIQTVRKPGTRLHLLGVTRTEHLAEFSRLGVASFDSTSPLRQAFKDDRDNYYSDDFKYTAIRIPQVEGNPGLQRKISSGQVSQEQARRLERACLEAMKLFEEGRRTVTQVVEVLMEYERFYDPDTKKNHAPAYEKTLREAPWRRCPCEVCQSLKYHVILFRGAERNRRRGFHNIWTLYRQLQRLGLDTPQEPFTESRQPSHRLKAQARG